MSLFGRGEEPDDWVARGEWREWDAPEADVALMPGAGRLLTPMLPPGGGPAEMPVPVGLAAAADGAISVEVGGYRVGRLAAGAADELGDALEDAPGGRLAVPGLILRGPEADAAPRVRLWTGRRLRGGMGVTLERQREAHASRVEPAPTPPGREQATG